MSHPRLSITPAGAIFDRSLEPRDIQVLNLLGCYTDKAGWCRRSQVKMAAQLKCGRSSVQRSIENLVRAGWVEKKRPPWGNKEGQPSNSFMYRVILDRDDFDIDTIIEENEADASESHAEIASDVPDCPSMGSDDDHTPGHPGAQPSVGTGAQPYVGTKNDPLERPLLERERDARARDRKARFLVSFEARWPTAALDDRQRTAYAAESLSEDEEEPCLAGIAPFLDDLKRRGRKNVPAGWKYIEQKRWTLLQRQKTATGTSSTNYPAGSAEARAITVLCEIAHASEALRRIWRRDDGSIDFRCSMKPQLLALAHAPPSADWVELNHRQGGSWEDLLSTVFTTGFLRHRPHAGSRAPWPWPPRKDGTLTATGPPDVLATEEDLADFK